MGRPPGKGKATKAIVKPKVVPVRKPRNAGIGNKKASSPASSTSGGHSNFDQESVSSDPSETNFPYDIRFNGVSSLLNVIHKATPEVKELLMDECEIILECRICRNLFRSFPNFLCHKQKFCKKLYNPATQSKYGPLLQCAENLYQLQYHIDASLSQSSDANIADSGAGSDSSHDPRTETSSEFSNKRLENIISNIKRPNCISDESKPSQMFSSNEIRTGSKKRKSASPKKGQNGVVSFPPNCISIEPLLNRAQDGIAFQSWISPEGGISCDKTPITDIKEDTAVLGLDGKMIYVGAEDGVQMFLNQITSEDLYESDNSLLDLQCNLCQTQFYTEKTLRLHTRKANCNSTVKGFTIKNSEVLSNGKRLLDLRDEISAQENGPSLSVANAVQRTLNPSPTKSLIFKRRKTSNRTDYNTAKENKSIIRSIFGPKKSPSKATKPKVPITETASIRSSITAQNNVKYKATASYSSETRTESDNEISDPPLLSTCIKCSASFSTKSEMSSHLALCTGVINLAFQRRICVPERKKICIQIRHNYEKEQKIRDALSKEVAQQENITPLVPPLPPLHSPGQCRSTPVSDTESVAFVHAGQFNNNVNEKPSKRGGAREVDQEQVTNELASKKSTELILNTDSKSAAL